MGNNRVGPLLHTVFQRIVLYTIVAIVDKEANNILLVLAVVQREMKHM